MDFQHFCDDFYRKYFSFEPYEASALGVVGYDHLLHDCSDEASREEEAFYVDSADRLNSIDSKKLTPDERVDYLLLRGFLRVKKYEIRLGERHDSRFRDAGIYIPISALHSLTLYATDAFEKNLFSRTQAFPHLVAQGFQNFYRNKAKPPKVWTVAAIDSISGGLEFVKALPKNPKVGRDVKDKKRLKRLCKDVRDSLLAYGDFLKREILPRSTGSYAVGEEHFNLLLRDVHFLQHNAWKLFGLGQKLFNETKHELWRLAEEIMPGAGIEKVARKIQDEHPSPKELLDTYQKAMRDAKAFVMEKKLVTFPPRETLNVVWTPSFERHEIPFAAYAPPAPNDSAQTGHYFVTPAEDEETLHEHNRAAVENTSVHESYPGHHLQFTVANSISAARTLPRLVNISSVFYEGWALYCEQLMFEEGFLARPEHRFVMLKDRLWRTLRIIIDVETQLGLCSYEKAAQDMMDELFFPRSQAEADLNWYSQAPSVPMGYALGWHLINQVRNEQKMKLGSKFNLRAFHDKLLSCGSIALPLVLKRAFYNSV